MSKLPSSKMAGLQIDDGEIRLAVATKAAGGYVVHARRRALPTDGPGRPYEVDAAANTLRGLLNDLPVRPSRVGLVLSGSQTIFRVEALDDAQDLSAISACEERMRQYVLFAGQPTCFGQSLQMTTVDGDYRARLLAAATRHDILAQRQEIAERCGLTLAWAEPALGAVARQILAAEWLDEPRFLLLTYNDGCELGVVRQDGLVFCHRLALGVEALSNDGAVLIDTLDRTKETHMRRTRDHQSVSRLTCCGLVSELDGFFGRLDESGIDPDCLDPAAWPQVEALESTGESTPEARAALAPVVAAALTDAGSPQNSSVVNLLPSGRRQNSLNLLSPWLLVPLVLVFLAAGSAMVWDQVARRQTASLTYILTHPTKEITESSKLLRAESGLRQRRKDAAKLLSTVTRREVKPFLEELPHRLPRDTWLERVEINHRGRCIVEGVSHTQDAVYLFTESLGNSPYVGSVRTAGTEARREGQLILTWFRHELTLVAVEKKAERPKKDDKKR